MARYIPTRYTLQPHFAAASSSRRPLLNRVALKRASAFDPDLIPRNVAC
jgi:hypothetical protein